MAEVKLMTDARKPEMTDVTADLAALKADVAKLTETLAAFVTSRAETATGTVRVEAQAAADAVKTATDKVLADGHAFADDARAKAISLGEDIQGVIERNPTTSVLTALGVGLLVGFLSRGRGA